MHIELLDSTSIDPFLQHLARNVAESGQKDTPIFAPFSSKTPWDTESRRNGILERWRKPLDMPHWERAWAVFEGNKIVGHLDLRAPSLETSLHRAGVGMGIENGYRHRGVGSRLMTHVLAWSREQPSISWIDLNVFAHNTAAIALYQKFGFREVGRIDDLFRIDGVSVDDIQMVLKL